jgi:hypothetical protein
VGIVILISPRCAVAGSAVIAAFARALRIAARAHEPGRERLASGCRAHPCIGAYVISSCLHRPRPDAVGEGTANFEVMS